MHHHLSKEPVLRPVLAIFLTACNSEKGEALTPTNPISESKISIGREDFLALLYRNILVYPHNRNITKTVEGEVASKHELSPNIFYDTTENVVNDTIYSRSIIPYYKLDVEPKSFSAFFDSEQEFYTCERAEDSVNFLAKLWIFDTGFDSSSTYLRECGIVKQGSQSAVTPVSIPYIKGKGFSIQQGQRIGNLTIYYK